VGRPGVGRPGVTRPAPGPGVVEGARGADPLPLARRTRNALVWSFLNNVVGRAGSMLTGVVLARILLPQDYGIFAVALVGLNAVLSMNELGVSLAIVRWPGDVRRLAPTVATLSTSFSSVLFVVTMVAAPAVCRALNAAGAVAAMRLLAVSLLIDAVCATPAAFMTREFQQNRRLVVDGVGLVVTAAVSITLALHGFGAWSLIWGQLVGNAVNAVFIIGWAPWRLRFGFRRSIARELLHFGLPLSAASLLVFAMLNLDYIVIAGTLGSVALGYYLMAFNLSSWPVNMLSAPVRRVSLAAFSRLVEDPSRGLEGFAKAFTMLLALTLPACLVMAICARPLVGLLYGGKWLPSAQVLPYLLLLGLVRVMAELAYDFLVALGRSRANVTVQAIWLVALLPALILGARWHGIAGVAVGHAVVAVVVVGPAYAAVLRASGVHLTGILRQCRRPLGAAAAAAVVGLATLQLVEGFLPRLAVGGSAFAVTYLTGVYPMRRQFAALRVAPAD